MTVPSRMSRASVCITGLMLLILASEAEGVMPTGTFWARNESSDRVLLR
jgi:hypothetical protein